MAKGIGRIKLSCDLVLHLVNDRQHSIQSVDYSALFFNRTVWKWVIQKLGAIDIRLVDTVRLHAVAIVSGNPRVEKEIQVLAIDNRPYMVYSNKISSEDSRSAAFVDRSLPNQFRAVCAIEEDISVM